jgi:hypothetical protein
MSEPKHRAKIEHELEILRTRYALMHKWGRISNGFSCITTGVITVIAICAFYYRQRGSRRSLPFSLFLAVAFCALYQWGTAHGFT